MVAKYVAALERVAAAEARSLRMRLALELNAADSCPSARLDCNQRWERDVNNVIVKTWWEHGPDCPKTAAIAALAQHPSASVPKPLRERNRE